MSLKLGFVLIKVSAPLFRNLGGMSDRRPLLGPSAPAPGYSTGSSGGGAGPFYDEYDGHAAPSHALPDVAGGGDGGDHAYPPILQVHTHDPQFRGGVGGGSGRGHEEQERRVRGHCPRNQGQEKRSRWCGKHSQLNIASR